MCHKFTLLSGPCLGLVQHQQVSGSTDGSQYGMRTWAARHSRQHPFSRAHLYKVCGVSQSYDRQISNSMSDSMTAAYLDKQPHLLEKWSTMNPLGRLGRPDELRGVIAWLASDASSFCTGSE